LVDPVDGYDEKDERRQRDELVDRQDDPVERLSRMAQPETGKKDQEKEQSSVIGPKNWTTC
jgi:hypothetical protein